MDPYREAHLFVATVRVISHNSKSPASIDDICDLIHISAENALRIARKLEKLNIVKIMEDPFSLRISVHDHTAIENLPREQEEEDSLAQELEAFKAKKQDMDKKVERIQADLAKKRESMFSDIEEKLKAQLGKKRDT